MAAERWWIIRGGGRTPLALYCDQGEAEDTRRVLSKVAGPGFIASLRQADESDEADRWLINQSRRWPPISGRRPLTDGL